MNAHDTQRPRFPTPARRRPALPGDLLLADARPAPERDPFDAAFARWRATGDRVHPLARMQIDLDEPCATMDAIDRVPGSFIRRIVEHWSAWPPRAA